MKSVEFVPKTDLKEYLIEPINVEILESFRFESPNFSFQSIFKNSFDILNSDNGSLNFLNKLYRDFHFFVQNMNDFNEVKSYFSLDLNDTINFIDALVFYYGIELTPIGEDTFDYLQRQAVKAGCTIFGFDFIENRMKKISLAYEEIINQIDSKGKLTKLLNFNTKVKTIYLRDISYYEETRNEFLSLIQKGIEKLEKLHSMDLLPDDNITGIIEVEALKAELNKAQNDIDYHKFILVETKADLELEQGLHLQTKAVLNNIKESFDRKTNEVISLNVKLDNIKKNLKLEEDSHIETKANAHRLVDELKIAKTVQSQLTFSLDELNSQLKTAHELQYLSSEAIQSAEKEKARLENELKITNEEKKHLEDVLTLTVGKLKKEEGLLIETKAKLEEVNRSCNELNLYFFKYEKEKYKLKEELRKNEEEIANFQTQLYEMNAKLQSKQASNLQINDDIKDSIAMLRHVSDDNYKDKLRENRFLQNSPNTVIEIKEINKKSMVKPVEKLKQFPAYLIHEQKEKLAAALRTEFSAEKGKPIRIMLFALEQFEPPLLTIGNRENKKIYGALKLYFDRDIGSLQSIFDNIITSKNDK